MMAQILALLLPLAQKSENLSIFAFMTNNVSNCPKSSDPR